MSSHAAGIAVRWHAVGAECRRQLGTLLGNPLGYVFILAFVLVAAGFLFIPDQFFSRNITDLWQLERLMPWMLAVILPALCMGAWSSERELGTEDQLLTLPMRISDVLLGKWLGLSIYFTVALACSLSNVAVLAWLGDPDLGLIVAQYQGWWLTGLIFAAFSLWASTMVGVPAVAFVFGLVLCGLAAWLLQSADWFAPFDRGVLPLPRYLLAALLVALPLCLAGLSLSLRRWQYAQQMQAGRVALVVLFAAVTLFNLSIVLDRQAIDVDLTEQNSSSLSPAAFEVLSNLEQTVHIHAYVSTDLPKNVALKGEEVLTKLNAIDRALGDRVQLELRRPQDAIDAIAQEASTHFDLEPKPVPVETVAGTDLREIFLGAVIRSGNRSQMIPFFEPGLSVEYELVRAVHAVSHPARQTVGIVTTDLDLMGGYDFQIRRERPRWEVVDEWAKQYELTEISLDEAIDPESIDVLVAPQPSRLSQEQLVRLHDAIWNGVPTLLLEDPLPMFAGGQLGTTQPKYDYSNPNAMGGPPLNGDVLPLIRSLGLQVRPAEIVWSNFNPIAASRAFWAPELVWCARDRGAVADHAITTGIDSVLLPWPGRVAPNRSSELEVTPLLTPPTHTAWGSNPFQQHFRREIMGMIKVDPPRRLSELGEAPLLAAAISGTMGRGYEALELADIEDTATDTSNMVVGAPSPRPINVVYVADTDFAHDQFFMLYRNENEQFSSEDMQALTDLDNVQFVSNAIDHLAGDEQYLALRARRPQPRPLEVLESVYAGTQKALASVEKSARDDAEQAIAELRSELQERLAAIDEREGLTASARMQEKAKVEEVATRQLQEDIKEVNRVAERRIREEKANQRRAIEEARQAVRWLAIGIPALFLSILIAVVFVRRLMRERSVVPADRQRSAA